MTSRPITQAAAIDPEGPPGDDGPEAKPAAALPDAVQRWLDRVDVPTRATRSAAIQGSARFRRDGNGWWMPIEAVMWHELGRNHVVDLRMGLGPLTFVRGLDGYIDQTGFSQIAHTLDVGREIDQAALLFMWSEALLFPAAWRQREDVTWSALDDERVSVTFDAPEQSATATIRFDPETGLPACFSAQRHKGPGSRLVEWIVDYTAWRPTGDGVLLPSFVTATWADEPGPWFKMKIERANPDVSVAAAMQRGRQLLAQAAADPTGIGTRR